ncbi:helicase-associated domain-containing protein [uncultured Jatrophihabitans sp.]|uniref:helicase-associated domain-containing protein n=1 Tax=uncultured Jatrophihabitans sp. TaxID=1610747 RepID=UPI0035C96572
MTASPVPQDSRAASSTSRTSSLTEWLRRRDDRQLAALLRLRPDLALPAAPDLAALGARLGVRTSTQRSVDGLDALTLRLLENLVLAAGADDAVSDGVVEDDLDALEALFDRALVWGDADLVHLTPAVRDAVGLYPAGLGRPASRLFAGVADIQLVPVLRHLGIPPTAQPRGGQAAAAVMADPDRLARELESLDDDEHETLDRLAAGPPVGTVRRTRDDDAPSAAARLIDRGLLVPIDGQRVELPREVGVALRQDRRGDRQVSVRPEAPAVRLVEREPLALDQIGTTAVLEVLRLADRVAESWSAQPPTTLRSGGLGVRELRRTARDLGVDEDTTAVVVETMYAAGLLNATTGQEPVYLPSVTFDEWRARNPAARWLALGSAWLAMTRQPGLVGQRGDRDRVITALGPDVERGTMPALRRQALGLLADLAPGAAPADREEVLALFAWHQPRRAAGQVPLVAAVLAEADLLGVTAAGGLTGYTRTMISGSVAAVERALDIALPAPVDHFLVQPDLTVVVPGPPVPALGVELGLVADLESTGGASVYRITERSVRRALDAGRTGGQLAAFVTTHSRTPVPQALTYLIDDAARRHGVLRAGVAGAYLRCDDVSLLDRVLAERGTAGLHLRRLAPTVLITSEPVTDLLDTLREAGFAPAAESPDGEVVTLEVDPPRAPARPAGRGSGVRAAIDPDAQATELVRRLRSGDALAGADTRVQAIARDVPGVTSAATMETLRRAVREAQVVWFGAAEADGSTTAHTLQPISLAAGTLRGYERGRSGLASYAVHRITAIRVLGEDEAQSLGEDEAQSLGEDDVARPDGSS